MIDKSLLDKIITGRVEPYIYAFSTNTIPNYLKVGDTYRSVYVRLEEWRKYFPELKKEFEQIAKVDDNSYFRDFSVHSFLENKKNRQRLKITDVPVGTYYSKEFFKNATRDELVEAIEDIKHDYFKKLNKYSFYNAETLKVDTYRYPRTEIYEPRPNQAETIQKFKQAVANGRTNLLMYAVMRFGKSFTSMCCAVENNAKLVVIVSAKADVQNEWKNTIESHVKFVEYEFYNSISLQANPHIITERLSHNKKVVLFLTLQDLSTENIKEKHQDIFGKDIDLLLIDESHFGARAEKFGKVLRDKKDIKASTHKYDEFIDIDEAQKEIDKTFKAKIKIHLSGTPYRILMGSEFEAEDIIAFYQFADIVQDQEKWNNEHVLDDNYKEWDNPYYGFPQMIRFAFNPSESARKKMKELRENGVSYAFSVLLKPKAIKRVNDNLHKEFEYKEEILELLEVIDGSKEDNEVLGFLNYDNIKNGKMCRHIVMVLPYCASCDAMEKLIKDNADKFKNLNEYEIINISGVDKPNLYKTTDVVKEKITECEIADKKTITLTVNRMLTGTTVQEWDTMIYLKDTASPQEYDQSIFRLQNQYIKKYTDKNGDVIKYNMKPQTLLVDFSPNRVFSMQEQKVQIYNVNVDDAGNSKLAERIKEELRISPIICINKNRIEEITPNDIMKAISEYSKNRGVAEETIEIPVDLNLLNIDIIKNVIELENKLGSKAGLSVNASSGEGNDMYIPDINTDDDTIQTRTNKNTETQNSNEGVSRNTEKQFRNYYARILFYSFLTEDTLISLQDLINTADTEKNTRILKNLGLNKQVLELMLQHMDKWALRKLDYKIQNINKLSHDDSIHGIDRCNIAVSKFGRLGESEVLTPNNICNDMINLITDEQIKEIIDNGDKILDIASKAGEFAVAIYQRLNNLGYSHDVISNSIYSIPTSTITYEFTRKIYEVLGLNIENIAENFTSYDLLKCKKEEDQEIDFEKVQNLLTQNKKFNEVKLNENILEGGNTVKFGAVLGNPPYQEEMSNNNKKDPIYPYFWNLTKMLTRLSTLITPARFLFNTGQTSKEWNEQMLADVNLKVVSYYSDSKEIFSTVDIKGGVAILMYNKDCNYGPIGEFIPNDYLRRISLNFKRDINNNLSSIVYSGRSDLKFNSIFLDKYPTTILDRLNAIRQKNPNVEKLSPNEEYELKSSTFDVLPYVFYDVKPEKLENFYQLLGLASSKRVFRWIEKKYMTARYSENNIEKYKVLLPESNGAGILGEVLSTPIVAKPNTSSTPTFISIGAFETYQEAENLLKYIKTKIVRALLGLCKKTQHNPASTWAYVPLQDFTSNSDIDWSKSVAEIDQQLYAKYGLSAEEIAFIESMIKPME